MIETHRFPGPERKVLGIQKAREDIHRKEKDEQRDDDPAKTELQAALSSLKLKIQKW